MPETISFVSALVIGFLGTAHCIGMCGGIVSALTINLHPEPQKSFRRMLPYLLAYNIGRLTSYSVAGFLVAWLAHLLTNTFSLHGGVGQSVSAVFMILLGLYITGWWPVLIQLERIGGKLWKRLEPIGKKWIPIQTPVQALLVGIVWGWLPCGMVYSMLAYAFSSSDPINGALIMFAFGLGTLPTLLAIGASAHTLQRLIRHPLTRKVAGIVIISFGIYILLSAGQGHHMHNM